MAEDPLLTNLLGSALEVLWWCSKGFSLPFIPYFFIPISFLVTKLLFKFKINSYLGTVLFEGAIILL